MPIGVPRIIYCWGEELPAQWTDIYNFIFRRRMVFLMQYLDDELCNQICGLLINIHMEDRSQEFEKKEMEQSGLFKSGAKQSQSGGSTKSDPIAKTANTDPKKEKTLDDLLSSDEDLGIEDNKKFELYTLQKISMEWVNWNAQFFDYSNEPYLFYLAELLVNPSQNDGQTLYKGETKEMTLLLKIFKTMTSLMNEKESSHFFGKFASSSQLWENASSQSQKNLEIYSPFRGLANFASQNYCFKDLNPLPSEKELLKIFNHIQQSKNPSEIKNFLSNLSQKKFNENQTDSQKIEESSEKVLGQRQLRKEYTQDSRADQASLGGATNSNKGKIVSNKFNNKAKNYLDFSSYNNSYNEFRDYFRKQTEITISEEEAKKVFVIINSFGGSVGNGITVHDALQFIKAGSLTLALGVAASAASLALAGGTIGERYVTEGCHVMIHQPEGGLQGQASDIWIDSQEILKIRLDVAEIYSLSTYRPCHKILRDLDRDFYLTATETIYYGLADEIATNVVMHEIIEMTSNVWNSHDSKQLGLLETRESVISGLETQND